jgi:PTS system beta-glucosides-specific IIC component
MNDHQLASRIGELVGGADNVNQVHTCATRLRFVLKDKNTVQRDELNKTKGVIQLVEQGGQTQVVIGPNVGDVYTALTKLPGWNKFSGDNAGTGGEKVGVINRIFDLLGGTFQPLLWPLIGASMIKMLLGLAVQFGWYDSASPPSTALVLLAASNAIFYFLPVFVGITAARKLGANPFLSGAIAASLLEPSFLLVGKTGDVSSFIGIPLYVFGYASSVFPALLAAVALSFLERGLKRVVTKNLQLVVIPTVALLVLVPLTALVFGPFGVLVGQWIASLLGWLGGISPILVSVALAGSFMFLVMLGLHWAIVPIMLSNVAINGLDPLTAAMGAYNFAVWGLAIGVVIRARRDPELRELAGAGAAAGLLAGISEPLLYGVILRFKRVIPIVLVGAVVGGVVIGLFNVQATTFVFSSIFSIPLMQPIVGYVIAIGAAFGVAMAGVLVFGYQGRHDPVVVGADADTTTAPVVPPVATPSGSFVNGSASSMRTGTALATRPFTVTSPVDGTIVDLKDVPDPVFAGGLVGPGVGILPSSGTVIAPADGTVIVAPASGHAVGIRTTDGAELLIHIGIDTVNLAGRGFRPQVSTGQDVRAGQLLVEFDPDVITAAGYSLVTPVLVTNPTAFGQVTPAGAGAITQGEALLTVAAKSG